MAGIERLSTTQEYNLSRQPRATLEREADEILEKHDINVSDFFRNDYESSDSDDKTLSGKPIEDLARVVVWCYSTPIRAVVTSTCLFVGAVHFGLVTLPVSIAYFIQGMGAGAAITMAGVTVKDMVKKARMNRKAIKG